MYGSGSQNNPPYAGMVNVAADEWDETDEYADSTLGPDESVSAYMGDFHYTYPNGRQYNPSTYVLPEHQLDVDRSNLKHHMAGLLFDGKLHFAPIGSHPQKILDLGTGSGKWAMDAADEYPMAHVIATDITPIQPTSIPPNLEFLLGYNYNREWILPQRIFDLVFSRWNHLHVEHWRTFLLQAFHSLRPGGYLELHEMIPHGYYSDDDTFTTSSRLHRWSERCREAYLRHQPELEVDLTADDLIRYMRRIGFEKIVVQAYKVPVNGWPRDAKYKEIGKLYQAQLLMSIEADTKVLLRRALGIDEDVSARLVAGAKTDLKNRGIHAYQMLHVIYGRRPDRDDE